ncbi:unnamed protein product [Rotaria sordida]|uniref:F-box domain-containing protein n=1 Tax=Rotaria sordida TaxID=392033 RepID=A0A814SCH7_9BILA|nr:unnamed protein product [Rotaria sordida]
MKFEQLPNELIFDVFEYLNAIHIFRAFYGLNSRFNKLLNISFKFYHLDFRSVSKYTFTNVCQQHLPLIIDKVVTFYLADDDETPNLPEIFLSYNFTLDKFIHLKSLSLQSIRSFDILNKIILQCHHLSYLTHFKLIQCLFNNEENNLINNIWNLPKLIYCHIDDLINNIEDKINELLQTFQTDFWIKYHQWFVRCDWNPSNAFSHAILYTLPYAFNDFHFINESYSKSTCPNEEDYWLYNQVQILQHENSISNNFEYFPIQFPNISHLEIILPFNEKFLSNIPSLNHLISLDVTLLPGDSVYNQLQLLLNRAPHLHLLRFSHVSDLEIILFKIHNRSIRRLDFFTKESMLYSWYFNKEQCIALANSSLGRQCQTLVIDIKHRTNVNDLINNMTNLQSLIFQCKDDKWNPKISSSTNDELIQWLHEYLPSTCLISRNTQQISIIQVWIR